MDSSVGANDVQKGNCVGRSSPLQDLDNQQRQAGKPAHLVSRRRSTLSAYYCVLLQSPLATSTSPKRLSSRQGTETSPTGPAHLPRTITPHSPRLLAQSGDRITC